MNKKLAVVAASGGMDSCVTAAIAAQNFELAMLHVNYGQRTEKRELKSFLDICDFYRVEKRMIIDISYLAKIGGSALVDKNIEIRNADLNSREIPSTYVPFRNANILSICVSWAEVLGAQNIFIGAVYEDSSGYPDCAPAFFEAFEKAANLGTRPQTKIKIVAPLLNMTKAEIVAKGMELNAPFHLTWSCYRDEEIACGTCDSCALRLRGFQEAGYDDPIPYKVKPIYAKKK